MYLTQIFINLLLKVLPKSFDLNRVDLAFVPKPCNKNPPFGQLKKKVIEQINILPSKSKLLNYKCMIILK